MSDPINVPTSHASQSALYYPFHLCHERTLQRLLTEYSIIHFRDYMALQLTPMSGTTASADRMGDYHQDFLQAGRIVQGYDVSGWLDDEMVAAVNRDLADATWRTSFHEGLTTNRRFQRGLFDLTHGMLIGHTVVPGPAVLLHLIDQAQKQRPYSVESLQELGKQRISLEDAYQYEYGLALIKTSTSLAYTIRLCFTHDLVAVTDSAVHFRLLERTCTRDKIALTNRSIKRDGY